MVCGYLKVIYLFILATCLSHTLGSRMLNITMPGARPTKNDAYLCHAVKIDEKPVYLTSFEPIHFPDVTHHMILFTCNQPGSHSPIWDCGDDATRYCNGRTSIIFSWAMNAPGMKMPKDTSIEVGTKDRSYLVLQVHYKDASAFSQARERRDHSGIKMTVQDRPTHRLVGIYPLITGGSIEPFGWSQLTAACRYTGRSELHPFAFRVHAHSHGIRNEVYLVRPDETILLGAKSPQKPQTFNPLDQTDPLSVFQGDVLGARCLMYNDEGRRINIGNTRQDEMCNVYLMYWVDYVDRDQLIDPDNQQCYSPSSRTFIPGLDDQVNNEVDEEFY